MKVWKGKLIVILFAAGGALFLVPLVLRLARGEPLDSLAVAGLCVAAACSVTLLVILVGRKSAGPTA